MSIATTSTSNFPVQDVTHKPKRLQSANLQRAREESGQDTPVVVNNHSVVVPSLTLENAIKFYEENAEGPLAKLYIATSMWLREVQDRRNRVSATTNEEDEEES